jgi:hypothetical protein
VVEHEDLIAEHRQAIEVFRAFLMRDRCDRRLQSGDVGLESDRHPVAKAPLHAGADRAQEPSGDRRNGQADCRDLDQTRPMLQNAFAEQHKPESQQSVR